MADIASSLAVLASFLLLFFGVRGNVRNKGRDLRSWLMVAAGLVLLGNVYLLTRPLG